MRINPLTIKIMACSQICTQRQNTLIFYLLNNVIKINIQNSIKDMRNNNKMARKNKAEQTIKMKTN